MKNINIFGILNFLGVLSMYLTTIAFFAMIFLLIGRSQEVQRKNFGVKLKIVGE